MSLTRRFLLKRLHIPSRIVEVIGWVIFVLRYEVQPSVTVTPENFLTANHQTEIRWLALGNGRKVIVMELRDVERE
jgi:hypothetical protein